MSTTLGDMTLIRESELLKDDNEKLLGEWFLLFNKKYSEFVEKIKFFELRP